MGRMIVCACVVVCAHVCAHKHGGSTCRYNMPSCSNPMTMPNPVATKDAYHIVTCLPPPLVAII